jgi:peptide/nickel transport system ATP-binding protein
MEEVGMRIDDLTKYFEIGRGLRIFGGKSTYVKAVDHVTFNVRKREIMALVGESGCGKTTIGFLIVRLEDPTSGHIMFEKTDIATLKKKELKKFRMNVQMIFQDPYSSLNPRLTVMQTVAEPLINHKMVVTADEARENVSMALEDVGLVPVNEFIERFPHELSGGERQRVAIARALVVRPKFIVADEPVSMLDVSIRAGVMRLMLDLREKYDIPFLFITHDIASARFMADRIAVMYLGKIVELAESEEVISNPRHPYTKALLRAVPIGDPTRERVPLPITGEIPSAIDIPPGCRFNPRCPWAEEICEKEEPELTEVKDDHVAACHFAVSGKEWVE